MRSFSLISGVLQFDLRIAAFAFLAVVYAFWGSPTPEDFGLVELTIALLLFMMIGAGGIMRVFSAASAPERWFLCGQVFLIFGICLGLIGALLQDWHLSSVLRDLIAFLFLFLPLFLMSFLNRDGAGSLVFLGCCLIGFVFALRASAGFWQLPVSLDYDALYYLGNSPLVLFTALLSLGYGLQALSVRFDFPHILKGGILLAVAILAILPLALTLQRASLAAVAVYALTALFILFAQAPLRTVTITVCLVGAVLSMFGSEIIAVFDDVMRKTYDVGENMRVQEWIAVWQEISGHPMTLLFGKGFGASFASPAVADISVTFTHSLFSSILWKLGLVGFLLCVFYIGALVFYLLRVFKTSQLIVMAIMAPLLIDTFLYAAYKSLDFGLLLSLIPVVVLLDNRQPFRISSGRIASRAPILYAKT